MQILLTNDDGIYAEGILALRKELEEHGYVVKVVAPDRERSASGHAITLHKPLHVDEVDLPSGGRGWSVNGTPADCTKLAIEAILPQRPDLVISGINRGANLGTDVFYSGTVSAAIEGALSGIPSLAVSLAAFENLDYTYAARVTRQLVKKVIRYGLPANGLLNINIPALEEGEIAGISITRLGVRKYRNVFDRRTDPRGKTYYWMAGDVMDVENDADSDVMALKNNLISITPIRLDLTDHDMIETLKKWELTD